MRLGNFQSVPHPFAPPLPLPEGFGDDGGLVCFGGGAVGGRRWFARGLSLSRRQFLLNGLADEGGHALLADKVGDPVTNDLRQPHLCRRHV